MGNGCSRTRMYACGAQANESWFSRLTKRKGMVAAQWANAVNRPLPPFSLVSICVQYATRIVHGWLHEPIRGFRQHAVHKYGHPGRAVADAEVIRRFKINADNHHSCPGLSSLLLSREPSTVGGPHVSEILRRLQHAFKAQKFSANPLVRDQELRLGAHTQPQTPSLDFDLMNFELRTSQFQKIADDIRPHLRDVAKAETVPSFADAASPFLKQEKDPRHNCTGSLSLASGWPSTLLQREPAAACTSASARRRFPKLLVS